MNNAECGILPLVGLSVCRALDFPWTPNTKFLNVLINGNYKGLYHLIETVERADNRIVTDKSGFVIENDAYWWKPNQVFSRQANSISVWALHSSILILMILQMSSCRL